MPLQLWTGQATFRGPRSENEDAVAVQRIGPCTLCLVADGTGGPGRGRAASEQVLQAVPQVLIQELPGDSPLGGAVTVGNSPEAVALQEISPLSVRAAIRSALLHAHHELLSLGTPQRGLGGSTAVLTLWESGRSFVRVASVGNSRAYLLRGDSLAQMSIHPGEREAEEGRRSGVEIRRCWRLLGGFDSLPPVQIQSADVQDHDRWLLCSDGVTASLSDDQIRLALLENDCAGASAVALCHQALEKGSRDNTSCIVADFRSLPAPPDPAWLHWKDGLLGKFARVIAEEQRYQSLPILGDILEDAGCNDQHILAHCRAGQPHQCGCWVVDWLCGGAH